MAYFTHHIPGWAAAVCLAVGYICFEFIPKWKKNRRVAAEKMAAFEARQKDTAPITYETRAAYWKAQGGR